MHPQQRKWDGKYADAPAPTSAGACAVLRDNTHLLPAKGLALDLACGLGANALLLAEHGLAVEARDISIVALEKLQSAAAGLAIQTRHSDIETDGLPLAHYDVICVSRFLHRPLCPALISALKPGGLLFYQTFCEHKPADCGPNSPAFLLSDNELLTLFAGLRLCYYREDGGAGDSLGQAQLIGRRSRVQKSSLLAPNG